jgi:mannosyltransferase
VDDKERTALLAGAVVVIATLAVAWLFSQVSPAWTTRYLGVLLGPMLLIGALGLARAGALGLVALVVILAIWAVPKSYGLENKSNASDLRRAAVPELREGDLVVSMQPEQTPLLAYHLEDLGGAPDLRFATPLGAVENERVMDWTDGHERMLDATPGRNLEPLLDELPRGGRVLLVHPVTLRADDWDAPWTQLVRRRSAQWGAALASDDRFEFVDAVPPTFRRATRIGVRGVIYEKTG